MRPTRCLQKCFKRLCPDDRPIGSNAFHPSRGASSCVRSVILTDERFLHFQLRQNKGTFLLPPVSLSKEWGPAVRYSYARSKRVNQNIFFGTCRDCRLFLPDARTGDGLLRPKWVWSVKMLTGLLEPTRSKVFFNGEDIRTDLVGFRRHLGYVPEEPNLYPYLSGREYLELIGSLRGMPPVKLERKIDSLLDLFSLYPHRHASIASYSKGMRQRILLTAALMNDPKLLIFDEPLSGLDVTTAVDS